jgi:hypothetical protein
MSTSEQAMPPSRKRTFSRLTKEESLQHKLDIEDRDHEYDPVAHDCTEIEKLTIW